MLSKTVFATLACALAVSAEFRAAAVKVDITPKTPQWLLGYAPRKSVGAHDAIYHRILAVDDGETQFILVSSDLCLFSPGLYDEMASDVERATGIDRNHFWWAVTHTHSAPEVGPRGVYDALLKGRSDHDWDRAYTGFIRSSLLAGVAEARGKLEPARLHTGTGMSLANINRRAKDADGKVTLGLNPVGPADRQIGLLRFERPDGTPIAIVANYAIHGTVLGGRSEVISGDAPGIAAAWVEQKLETTVLFVNGAAGDLAPIYSVYDNPKSGHLLQFRVLLGERIIEANRGLGPGTADVKIRASETVVESPLKPGLAWPAELSRYSRPDQEGGTLVRLPVRFLTIGDTVLWAAPVELFSEIAMQIRNSSPFAKTFYFGYVNGWFGYLPTATAMAEGGYEPATSVFTEAMELRLKQHVLTFLQGAKK